MMAGLGTQTNTAEVTLDWSSFDATVPNYLIDHAFDIVEEMFDDEYAYHDGELVFGGQKMAYKNAKLFKWLRDYFKYTKIMLPNGQMLRKHHGIPSGSFFTQAIGSIVNYILVRFIQNLHGLNAYRTLVLGDDSSFLVPTWNDKDLDFRRMSETVGRLFHMILNPKKVILSTRQQDRKFLGYQVEGYKFVRPEEDWLKLVLYPERDVEFLERSAARVFAYYLLGGHSSDSYCQFFRRYFRYYPGLTDVELPLSKGLIRLFKFVMRIDIQSFTVPSLRDIDLTSVPYILSLGDSLYAR